MNTKSPILAIIAISVLLSSASGAFAIQPYIGLRQDTATIYYVSSFFGYSDHGGLKPTTYPIQSIFSSTGAVSSSTTDPDAWGYQTFVTINPDATGTMEADMEIRDCNGGSCVISWSKYDQHGTYSNTAYVYQIPVWQGSVPSRTGINFYHEWHYTSGSIQTFLEPYTKKDNNGNNNGDPSQYFLAGNKSFTIGSCLYYIKFLQFGAESTGGEAGGWKYKQYGMGFTSTAGTQYLANFQVRSTQAGQGCVGTGQPDNGSTYLTYRSASPGPYAIKVGANDYTANANYALRGSPGCGDSSLPPAGTVKWCKDPTELPAHTRLW